MAVIASKVNLRNYIHSHYRKKNNQLNKNQSSYIRNIFQQSKFQQLPLSSKRCYSANLQGDEMSKKSSAAYRALCTEYYELDKPVAPADALSYYREEAKKTRGPILEPMCGSGRFLVPLLSEGFDVTGFDTSEHMLRVCRRKCADQGLNAKLFNASFEDFLPSSSFGFVFIPSGSFCLLTEKVQINAALNTVHRSLSSKGRFVFEIDTIRSINTPQEVWKGHWIDKPDGSKLVLNTFSRFEPLSQINIILCKYELWEENSITKVEVEDFRVKLYEEDEMEELLKHHGFKMIGKYLPYTSEKPSNQAETILYVCEKL